MRHLHSTLPPCASNSANASEKIDEAELARLMEQFEGNDSKGKVIPEMPPPARTKRKSKIEDYDAWHGWDGESDKGPQHNAPSGINEVDRYISDVLNDVAKTKAARSRAAEGVVTDKGASDVEGGSLENVAREDGKRDISFDGKITGTLGFPQSTSAAQTRPVGNDESIPKTTEETKTQSSNSKTPTFSTFSKADMAALAKKLQIRLDEEIKRLKTQKEVVKQLLSTRAEKLGKDAQVQFGLLGGKVNEVTGYNEIERLKQDVRERGEHVVTYECDCTVCPQS